MNALGYVEGKTVIVDRRSAEGDFARLPALAQEIVKNRRMSSSRSRPPRSLAAKQATSTLPIVVVGSTDPVAGGLVVNLARPGGNITGTATQTMAAVGKLLELVPQLVPGAKRPRCALGSCQHDFQQLRMGETLMAAARLHLFVHIIEVKTTEDIERVFTGLRSDRPDAVVIPADTFFLNNAARVAEVAITHRLPLFGTGRALTEAGILANYGANTSVIARRSATYVHRILKGAKPGDLPIEQPTQFELVLNLRTAKALGLTLPRSIVQRADEVIA